MENPNVKFTIQFIINYLVLSILLGVVGRLIAAALVTTFSINEHIVCYVIVFTQELIILISVILSIFMTQRSLRKKGELTGNSNMNLYAAFCFALIIINAIISVICFSHIYKICEGNVSLISLANNLVDSNGITFDDAMVQSKQLIRTIVKKAIIIADVSFTFIIVSLVPVFNKYHKI